MSESPAQILLVEDDVEMRRAVERILEREGHHVTAASDGAAALGLLASNAYELVLTDVLLPRVDGFELLRRIRTQWPYTEVVMFTGQGSVERAVEAIKQGAYDFVEKGREDFRTFLVKTVSKAIEKQSLSADLRRLLALVRTQAEERLVGNSRSMRQIREMVHQIAATDVPILIRGESGTGKEVVADLIHSLSPRAAKPFVKISCAAIPDNLLESELFGYERGAFTGALTPKPGRFEMAHGGSIFLDEIGEMAAALQAKLLRVLEDGRVQRLGSTRDVLVDVRVISATNADIEQSIKEKRFRSDLYYRLNVVEILIDAEAMEALESAQWPGNVRELENTIQRALALSHGPRLTFGDVHGRGMAIGAEPEPSPGEAAAQVEDAAADGSMVHIPIGMPLEDAEDQIIAATLRVCGGDKERAARMLGISSRTIYRRMTSGRSLDWPKE